jgi:hypothetical protein
VVGLAGVLALVVVRGEHWGDQAIDQPVQATRARPR